MKSQREKRVFVQRNFVDQGELAGWVEGAGFGEIDVQPRTGWERA
jgi:hypothetical protein